MQINPQLLQMLTSQLDLNATELETLQSGDYLQFFRQRMAANPGLASDPMMIALMGSLTSPEPTAPESDEDDAQEIDARVVDTTPDDGIETQALSALRYVAQILGACHCWGQNDACLDCHGCGEPGYRRPKDPATFVAWVRPGLQRMGLRLVRVDTSAQLHKTEN